MRIQRKHYRFELGLFLLLSLGHAACGEAEQDEDAEQEEDEEGEGEDEDEESEAQELPKTQEPDEEEKDEQKGSEKKEKSEEPKNDEGPKEEPDSDPDPDPKKPDSGDKGPKQDVCNETVPAKHYVDNIPAYAQCAQSMNAKIWSNDGINTATSSQGDGWVPTQWGGGYQCTEFAKRYMYFRFGVEKFPNGNAGVWCEGSTPAGLEKKSDPVHGDLIIFGPGACGASLVTGHVGVVDKVDASTKMVEFVEQNQANRRSCAISTAACFLHATANK